MQFSTENKKKITFLAVIVILAAFAYSLSLSFTGYISMNSIEKKLNDAEKLLNETQLFLSNAREDLENAENSVRSCENSLSVLNPQLAECSLDILSARATAEKCQEESASCESNLTTARSQYAEALSNYKLLAASSAASICCSFNDFQQASVKSWKIDNSKIVCNAGNLTVNCRTGETNI